MGVIDRGVEELVRRTGRYYVHAVVGLIGAAVVFVVVPVYSALLFPYIGATAQDYRRVVAAFALAMVPATAGLLLIALRSMKPVVRWTAGDHRDPAGAWAVAVASLPGLVVRVGLWYGAACLPPALHVATFLDFTVIGAALYVLFVLLLIIGLLVLGYLFVERALRPIVAEIAEHLPPDFEPRRPAPTLAVKMLVLLPAINLYTGVIVAAVSTNDLDVQGRLAVSLAAAILVTCTVSFGLTQMVRHSLLRRLGDLREALARVDAGDYGARLPFLAGDEMDEVGRSFNRMASGLQDARARIVTAGDAERRRLERDLHDGAQQRLVLAQLKLGMLKDERAEEVRTELRSALKELRELAHGIYPALLENEGLTGALSEAAKRMVVRTEVDSSLGRHPQSVEAAVYFCCLEGLQNAAKHAGENATVGMRLWEDDEALHFEIADDGAGFDGEPPAGSGGVQNMADRIGALGGRFSIRSRRGQGTTVSGVVPLQ